MKFHTAAVQKFSVVVNKDKSIGLLHGRTVTHSMRSVEKQQLSIREYYGFPPICTFTSVYTLALGPPKFAGPPLLSSQPPLISLHVAVYRGKHDSSLC